jgi:hypothetical protein
VYFVFDDLSLAEYNNDEDANEDDVRAEVFDRVPSSDELEYFETILESPVYLILEHIRCKMWVRIARTSSSSTARAKQLS